MPFKNDGKHVQKYVYDFAVDGGAQGVITLSGKAGYDPLPAGAIVTAVAGHVLTACLSGGSATVIWGSGDDADGYSGPTIAVGSLTANAVFNGWDNAAVELWDDTNDHPIYKYIDEITTSGKVTLTIATADLTAGKIVLFVEYLYGDTAA